MRGRDVRAILFCVISTMLVWAALSLMAAGAWAAFGVAAAYQAWLLRRPRMRRVVWRLDRWRAEPARRAAC